MEKGDENCRIVVTQVGTYYTVLAFYLSQQGSWQIPQQDNKLVNYRQKSYSKHQNMHMILLFSVKKMYIIVIQ